MIRPGLWAASGGVGIPRESGDDPDAATLYRRGGVYSPRERG